MNYEQFLEQMKEDLQARFAEDLPPELADVRIGIRDVEKLQGESYRGLSFRSGDSPVEANLNMTGAFQAFEAGRPYEDILEEVEAQLMKVVDRTPQFNIGELTDYEAMKPKLMMEVIPQKGNEDRLENIPHADFPGTGSPYTEKPDTAESCTENPREINKDRTSKERSSTEIINKRESKRPVRHRYSRILRSLFEEAGLLRKDL